MKQSPQSKKKCSGLRKKLGLCRDCPNISRPGKALCEECLQKQLDRQKEYAKERPWVKEASHRLRAYGVTQERFMNMLFEQNGRCAMCKSYFLTRPDVDHSHRVGNTRGLLCHRCNTGLGYIEDEKFLENAKIYLEKNKNG